LLKRCGSPPLFSLQQAGTPLQATVFTRTPGASRLAVTPDTGDAFIREVDDEYRRERTANFVKRYGRYILLALGLGLVAAAGLLYWRSIEDKRANQRGAQLMKAQSLGAGTASAAELAQLERAPEPGYRALARLTEAANRVRVGDNAGATKLYAAIAADKDFAEPFRNLALVNQTRLEFDQLDPSAVVQRLQPLTQPGGPWFGTAGELTAMAYLRQGKSALALPLMEALLSDRQVPSSIQQRIAQLYGAMAPDGGRKLAERLSAAARPQAQRLGK